jgi:hypothetical protein
MQNIIAVCMNNVKKRKVWTSQGIHFNPTNFSHDNFIAFNFRLGYFINISFTRRIFYVTYIKLSLNYHFILPYPLNWTPTTIFFRESEHRISAWKVINFKLWCASCMKFNCTVKERNKKKKCLCIRLSLSLFLCGWGKRASENKNNAKDTIRWCHTLESVWWIPFKKRERRYFIVFISMGKNRKLHMWCISEEKERQRKHVDNMEECLIFSLPARSL